MKGAIILIFQPTYVYYNPTNLPMLSKNEIESEIWIF